MPGAIHLIPAFSWGYFDCKFQYVYQHYSKEGI